MNHLTITNILLLFCGFFIKFLYALQKQKSMKIPFQMGFFIQDNWISVSLTLVAGFASLLMSDDLVKLLHIQAADNSPFYSIHALLSGIVPLFFIEKILNLIGAKPNE